MKKRNIGIIILSVMLLVGCGGSDTVKPGENLSSAVTEETEQKPYVLEFEATTIAGENVTGACFGESRLTMINIWATYCNPCISEMPDLGAMAADYDSSDFQIYGIISDVTGESDDSLIQEAKNLIEETGATYPHLLLNESLYTNLVGGTSAVPTTFFVNQKGEVLGYVVGARSKAVWEELINELLAQNP
ncbi:MAG: TlpA family protein disulfide reductase [Lachnospiraceae bacterium]|nr:TlpA family protein disulfide reductase [Lachnospiraceae bacterium]